MGRERAICSPTDHIIYEWPPHSTSRTAQISGAYIVRLHGRPAYTAYHMILWWNGGWCRHAVHNGVTLMTYGQQMGIYMCGYGGYGGYGGYVCGGASGSLLLHGRVGTGRALTIPVAELCGWGRLGEVPTCDQRPSDAQHNSADTDAEEVLQPPEE